MALEQEIKMKVDSQQRLDISVLETGLPLQVKDKRIIHLHNTYFDTADRLLERRRLGLRMRKSNDRWLQTVKTAGKVKAGLHQREEWEFPLMQPEWDRDALMQTPLRDMIMQENLMTRLNALFTTDFIRESYDLVLDEGTEVELAYDKGEVRAHGRRQPIHEIELELKAGQIAALNSLSQQLMTLFPLTPSQISKAQMGYQLLEQ